MITLLFVFALVCQCSTIALLLHFARKAKRHDERIDCLRQQLLDIDAALIAPLTTRNREYREQNRHLETACRDLASKNDVLRMIIRTLQHYIESDTQIPRIYPRPVKDEYRPGFALSPPTDTDPRPKKCLIPPPDA